MLKIYRHLFFAISQRICNAFLSQGSFNHKFISLPLEIKTPLQKKEFINGVPAERAAHVVEFDSGTPCELFCDISCAIDIGADFTGTTGTSCLPCLSIGLGLGIFSFNFGGIFFFDMHTNESGSGSVILRFATTSKERFRCGTPDTPLRREDMDADCKCASRRSAKETSFFDFDTSFSLPAIKCNCLSCCENNFN